MKTNIKMRVTPEQSKKVKEIVFANGGRWVDDCRYQKYIGLRITKHNYLHEITCEDAFEFWNMTKEVDADLFIRTNGTCEEESHAELKRKYKSGDYILLVKTEDGDFDVEMLETPSFLPESEYKLINKHHKKVLEHCLNGGEVLVLNSNYPEVWKPVKKFIEDYNEEYTYKVKKDKLPEPVEEGTVSVEIGIKSQIDGEYIGEFKEIDFNSAEDAKKWIDDVLKQPFQEKFESPKTIGDLKKILESYDDELELEFYDEEHYDSLEIEYWPQIWSNGKGCTISFKKEK